MTSSIDGSATSSAIGTDDAALLRVDQHDPLAGRGLQEAEHRCVGALPPELGVERHAALRADAVGELACGALTLQDLEGNLRCRRAHRGVLPDVSDRAATRRAPNMRQMPIFEQSCIVRAPIDEVFAFHLDTRNAARIAPSDHAGVGRSRNVPPDRGRRGGDRRAPVAAAAAADMARAGRSRRTPEPRGGPDARRALPLVDPRASLHRPGGRYDPIDGSRRLSRALRRPGCARRSSRAPASDGAAFRARQGLTRELLEGR